MNKGIYFIIFAVLLSGGANFFNKLAMQAIKIDPFQYTTLKNIVAALLISIIILTPFAWKKVIQLKKADWLKLLLIAVIGGSIPFLLFFKGLSMTSAVSASFIHKTLFIWIAILAWPLLKEKMNSVHIFAIILLLVGNVVFEGFKFFSWGYAETLILLATLLWAVETIIVKKSLVSIDPIVLAWGRMFIGCIMLVIFLLMTNNVNGMFALGGYQFGWILLVSALLAGYVVLWYKALNVMPATVVSCFLVLASPITAFLNAAFITHNLSSEKILGATLIMISIVLLSKFKLRKNNELATATT